MVQFQLVEYYFETMRFQRLEKPAIPAGTSLNLEQKIKISGNLIEKDLWVKLAVEIGQAELPFALSNTIAGHFVLEEVPEADALKALIHVNCAAILFPFVREAIAESTRKGGFNPLLLPPMNFVNLYQANQAKQEEAKAVP